MSTILPLYDVELKVTCWEPEATETVLPVVEKSNILPETESTTV